MSCILRFALQRLVTVGVLAVEGSGYGPLQPPEHVHSFTCGNYLINKERKTVPSYGHVPLPSNNYNMAAEVYDTEGSAIEGLAMMDLDSNTTGKFTIVYIR